MYLVVTTKRDLTSDFVVLELQRRGHEVVRLNTEDMPQGVICCDSASGAWMFNVLGRSVHLSEVKAAYFRRPGKPQVLEQLDPEDSDYCAGEWLAALQSLYWALEGRWLNSPHAIAIAENKVRQLEVARKTGLRVPPTLVTNDPEAAAAFAIRHKTIGKPLRNSVIRSGGTERVMFTSRVHIGGEKESRSIRVCPVILQQEIPKRFDIRVTVVGDKVFSASIDSQSSADTEVDWRCTSDRDLPHSLYKLPAAVATQCVTLTRKLGLRFGALDFVLDPEGQLWFLEINPNGQWGWIQTRTGQPIAAAIACELEGIADEAAT
jgi:glutathione synthase/RimK-type ligase-like ATP-grasp enzyme